MTSFAVKTTLISSIIIALSLTTFPGFVEADKGNNASTTTVPKKTKPAPKNYSTSLIVDGYNYTYHVHCMGRNVSRFEMNDACAALKLEPGTVRSTEANDALAALTDEGILLDVLYKMTGAKFIENDYTYYHNPDAAHNDTEQVIAYANYKYDNLKYFKSFKKYCTLNQTEIGDDLCFDFDSNYDRVMISPKSYATDRHWFRVSSNGFPCPGEPIPNCYVCQDVKPGPKTTKPTTQAPTTNTTQAPTTNTTQAPTTNTTQGPTTNTTQAPTTTTTQGPTTNTTQAPTTTTLKPTSVPGPTKVPTSPPGPVSLSPTPIVGPCYNNLPSLILTAVMIFAMIY